MNKLEKFLRPTQKALFMMLGRMFGRDAVRRKGSYILVPGEAPVMLVAHLDTVHKMPVMQIRRTQKGNVLTSPQGIGGDDRCGVYALVAAHGRSPVKPWLLFTCDEEKGGIGAKEFCGEHGKGNLPGKLDHLKAIIEVDRKGKNDAVYYNCGNKEFEAYIAGKGFKTGFGSFSDISYVAPELGVAAVNLSSGYYDPHTKNESINLRHLNATVDKVVEIVGDSVKADFPKYEYMEADSYRYCGWGFGRCCGWHGDIYGRHFTKADSAHGHFRLSGVPADLRDMYEDLMDFYSFRELEEYRMEFGDNCIPLLYEAEFGMPYDGLEEADMPEIPAE